MNTFDAMGAVFATLTNAGPGLGFIHESFIGVPESAKLVFSFAMICGRLEMFSLIVLFIPSYWKNNNNNWKIIVFLTALLIKCLYFHQKNIF